MVRSHSTIASAFAYVWSHFSAAVFSRCCSLLLCAQHPGDDAMERPAQRKGPRGELLSCCCFQLFTHGLPFLHFGQGASHHRVVTLVSFWLRFLFHSRATAAPACCSARTSPTNSSGTTRRALSALFHCVILCFPVCLCVPGAARPLWCGGVVCACPPPATTTVFLASSSALPLISLRCLLVLSCR